MSIDVARYMSRPCLCGLLRKEHAHLRDADGVLRIVPPHQPSSCPGFTDAIEKELGGNPWRNALLRPLIEEEAGGSNASINLGSN